MIITIKVLQVVDGDAVIADRIANQEGPPRGLIVARGYMPNGQELITSGVCPANERVSVIRLIVEWIFRNRPSWSVAIDDSHGSTAVVS